MSSSLSTETRFTDLAPTGSEPYYHLRAIALHPGASGSYFNSSQGVFVSRAGAPPSAGFEPSAAPDPAASGETIWIDDVLPPAATSHAIGNRWNWVTANPSPQSGARAHQSDNTPGLHLHFFVSESAPLAVGTGDILFAYVYLDPENPPRQLILSVVAEGIDGGPAGRPMGRCRRLASGSAWKSPRVPSTRRTERRPEWDSRSSTGERRGIARERDGRDRFRARDDVSPHGSLQSHYASPLC